ncbi:hypothetical protein I6F07_03680 [Ensifer sp. IC4062]|nr:hypothetical protein [Ensifer sp. IC4062]MCA1439339.1 hypothetical protein [Ensifer sp. IC4062]
MTSRSNRYLSELSKNIDRDGWQLFVEKTPDIVSSSGYRPEGPPEIQRYAGFFEDAEAAISAAASLIGRKLEFTEVPNDTWGRDEVETGARLDAWNQPIHRTRGRIEKIFGT